MNEAYKPAPHVAWRRVDEKVVVLNLNTSDYYSLADAGARMWELMAEGHPAEKVAVLVAEEYGAQAGVVQADLGELVTELLAKSLLEPAR